MRAPPWFGDPSEPLSTLGRMNYCSRLKIIQRRVLRKFPLWNSKKELSDPRKSPHICFSSSFGVFLTGHVPCPRQTPPPAVDAAQVSHTFQQEGGGEVFGPSLPWPPLPPAQTPASRPTLPQEGGLPGLRLPAHRRGASPASGGRRRQGASPPVPRGVGGLHLLWGSLSFFTANLGCPTCRLGKAQTFLLRFIAFLYCWEVFFYRDFQYLLDFSD